MIPTLEYFLLLVLGAIAWLIGHRRPDILSPLGELIARVMHHRNTRLALVVVWWWLGWHFFTV